MLTLYLLSDLEGVNMSLFLKGCKVLALRTGLGAGINTAKFQEVLVFDGVFMCQVIDNHRFFRNSKHSVIGHLISTWPSCTCVKEQTGEEKKGTGYYTLFSFHMVMLTS